MAMELEETETETLARLQGQFVPPTGCLRVGAQRRPSTPADQFRFHCPTILRSNPRSTSYNQKTSAHEPTTSLLLSRRHFFSMIPWIPHNHSDGTSALFFL